MIEPAVVQGVRVTDVLITFALADGRELSAPTGWSERLRNASASDRTGFVIESDGMVIESDGMVVACPRSTSTSGSGHFSAFPRSRSSRPPASGSRSRRADIG
jgi:hypothetical protein